MYFPKLAVKRVENLIYSQEDIIRSVAGELANIVRQDKLIYAFGTGHSHMIPMEMFGRAGGLANVVAVLDPSILNGFGAMRSGSMERLSGLADIIWEQYDISRAALLFLVSNSGRNSVVVEMALRAKIEGIRTVAITSLEHSKHTVATHSSGKKLFEISDFVIDNGAPYGDCLIQDGGRSTGGFSSFSGIAIVQTVISETVRLCNNEELTPPLFQSQNTENLTNNEALYRKYKSIVPHM
ncbi:sugar isomerase domain-containing protein [Ruegeria sp. EL01]|uniref:sugar isomerase domain-containing protein n=1 Tax=Ruegeria sp. EL01 TaxID=2107578 RepID=UPI000EA811A4|nr:sugar isomerase domain-containing protein [Ruegeria sp. EL01]